MSEASDLEQCKLSLAQLVDRVDAVDRLLRGNGQRGLLTEVELMKRDLAELHDFKDEVRKSRQWSTAAALTVIGQAALTLFQRFVESV